MKTIAQGECSNPAWGNFSLHYFYHPTWPFKPLLCPLTGLGLGQKEREGSMALPN